MSVATEQRQFTALMRLFHWLTAALVLTSRKRQPVRTVNHPTLS
jgi:hypothetical protein